MTTKKNTTKPTEPEVIDHEVVDQPAPTDIEAEVQSEAEDDAKPRTFTVEIMGEEATLEDKWERENPPAALAMVSKPQHAEKYMVSLLEQLVGEDQLIKLLDLGADVEELGKVVRGWAEERGAKN